MLTKCVLCVPMRGGKAHQKQRLAWTRSRLSRWLNGERAELWHDLPKYTPPRTRKTSEPKQEAQKHRRCVNLTREGGFGAACKALTKGAPLGHTAAIRNQLQEKHPANPTPPNLSTLGHARAGLAPEFDAEAVERAIRSFHRLSSGGPSALRP
eukprot:4233189-Karenia_brevis.AAC.1